MGLSNSNSSADIAQHGESFLLVNHQQFSHMLFQIVLLHDEIATTWRSCEAETYFELPLQIAAQLDPTLCIAYSTLGNVYASLALYNK